ncbi:MAG TPA: site-specific integrase [Burkholderiaceae bacterium]|nr:site-specific integrase [Burkholderiaceae bacterium]
MLYYFDNGPGAPKRWHPLGSDLAAALTQYGTLINERPVGIPKGAQPAAEAAPQHPGLFSTVAARYRREVLPTKGRKTQLEQDPQLDRLVKVFGEMDVAEIEPQHIRQWLDWRAQPDERGRPRRAAANREKALLSHIINKAREWGVVAGANPCVGIRGFKESPRSRYVTDDELRKILSKADAPLAAALRLAYLTAQRPQDVLAMRWADVQNGYLHVAQRKTGTKLRIVVEGKLAVLIGKLKAGPKGEFLIRDDEGNPLTANMLRNRFEKARAAAGVSCQFRDIRAKSATDVGDLETAQRLLGHTQTTTTDRYLRGRVGGVVRPLDRKV